MPLFIGIDGGGTKTTCAVGDDVSVRAVATGAGSNVVRLGEKEARAGLHEAIAGACAKAEVSPLRVQAACIGAAGAANPEINAAVKDMMRQVLPNACIQVVGDMVIAMEAAFPDLPGVIAIAGTGSIVYGRNQAGETARAGGWGYRISDEGSGEWIGRTAVAESMRAQDAGRKTTLLERIAQEWKLSSPDEIVSLANATPGPKFADLFPVVQKAAMERDVIAGEVLTRAGAELAQLVLVVLHRLWKPGESVRIAVAGGVFTNSEQVRRAFYNSVHAAWLATSICFKVTDPVLGALWMARRMVAALGAP